ncbi:gametocyte-specific factor 1-like [Prorops nasuta]|uniref:gametocyte-specific factor 1-like n=1 Tax=Prorops nasuta TaxID=863751 RepID=UPI0034CEF782
MEVLLKTCPYDSAHRIIANRLQCHLIKCAKNFPNTTKVKCPYNQTHVIEMLELESHISECSDRGLLEMEKVKYKHEKSIGIVPINVDLEFPSGEKWEDLPFCRYL